MNFQRNDTILSVTGVRDLIAHDARRFRTELCDRLTPDLEVIDIDLSATNMVDGCGLGALMFVYKFANEQHHKKNIRIRLLNPLPTAQQLFELTRMHHLFELVSSNGEAQPNSISISIPDETRSPSVPVH